MQGRSCFLYPCFAIVYMVVVAHFLPLAEGNEVLEDFSKDCFVKSGGVDCRKFRKCCEGKICPRKITTSMSCTFDQYAQLIKEDDTYCKCTMRHSSNGRDESVKFPDFDSCHQAAVNCSQYLSCCDRFKICAPGMRRIRLCEGTTSSITTTGCMCIPDHLGVLTTIRPSKSAQVPSDMAQGGKSGGDQTKRPQNKPKTIARKSNSDVKSTNGSKTEGSSMILGIIMMLCCFFW